LIRNCFCEVLATSSERSLGAALSTRAAKKQSYQYQSPDLIGWKELSHGSHDLPRTEKEVTELAPGVVFHFRQDERLRGFSERLLLKVRANEWLTSSSIIDLNTALQKLKEHLQKPPGKGSGYWRSDHIVFYELNHECSGRLRQAKLTLPD
jgi:hypothetical protein